MACMPVYSTIWRICVLSSSPPTARLKTTGLIDKIYGELSIIKKHKKPHNYSFFAN